MRAVLLVAALVALGEPALVYVRDGLHVCDVENGELLGTYGI